MTASYLSTDQIDRCWDSFANHLERFSRECETDFVDDLKADLLVGLKQLWLTEDGLVITRIAECPNGPVCEIYAACGNAHGRINECLSHIEAWAKSINCKRMRVLGRKGWVRVLKAYRQTGIILEKEL